MIFRRSTRSISIIATGSFLVLVLMVGIAIKETHRSKDSRDQLAVFNEQLVARNFIEHQNAISNLQPSNPVNLRKTIAKSAASTAEDTPAEDKNHTLNNNPDGAVKNSKPDFIKPLVGRKQVETHAPEFDWLDTSTSIDEIIEVATERNLDRGVYAWLQLRSDTKPSELNELIVSWGAKVIDTSAKHVRVKLPSNRETLVRIAELPEVEGFGVMPPEEKHGPHLMAAFENIGVGDELPVFITTMADDADGTMKRELIAMGVTIGHYETDIQTYLANVDQVTLDAVLVADFVAEVATNMLLRAMLSDLTAVLGADIYRSYSSGSQSFTGDTGAGVRIGVLDTGINANHKDFSDKTICAKSFVPIEDDIEARVDSGYHGTHVSGIAVGSGKVNPGWAGVAPGVSSVRVGKVLDVDGFGDGYMFINGVNFMSAVNPCPDVSDSGRPQVVNVSLGDYTPANDGTALLSRKMDAASYDHRQNYVISAANGGPARVTDTPSTKNVLSVGATTDSGVITSFSAHGPTADGRLAPHVVAPGNQIISALGGGNLDQFIRFSGTSMSSPAVAGLAAVFLESNDEFDTHPAAVRSSIMAAAIKPRLWIGSEGSFASDNTDGPGDIQVEYGLGMASLVPFDVAGVDHDSLKSDLNSDEMASTSITVSEGTARLDIVLTWYEPATLTLGKTVISDLDLYLDKDNDCTEDACGEYSSRSKIDNVEWLLIKDPEPGTYQLKVIPDNAFDHSVQFGVSWVTITDDVAELSVTSDSSSITVASGDYLEVDLSLDVSAYVATGTTLHVICRSNASIDEIGCPAYDESDAVWLPGSKLNRPDDTQTNLDFENIQYPLHLGAISVDTGRELTMRVPSSVIEDTGSHTLYFVATSWNGKSGYKAIDVIVSGSESVPSRMAEPTNNEIEDAIALTGESGTLNANLALATRDPGEPMLRLDPAIFGKLYDQQATQVDSDYYVNARHNSVWYKIDSLSKTTQLSFSGIPRDVSVIVYRDTPHESSRVGHNSTPDSSRPVVVVNLVTDTIYYIQLYAHIDVGSVSVPWQLGPPQAPTNDHFANAQAISGNSGTVSGTNFNASLEPFEFYGDRVGYSTWYSWSPEESGTYRFNARSFDLIVVFEDANQNQLRRVSTTPEDAFLRGQVYVHADSNQTYKIAVLSLAGVTVVDGYELDWTSVTSPVKHADNDRFSQAMIVSSTATQIYDDTEIGRTVDPGETRESGTGTRWWRWTPTTGGDYTFALSVLERYQASVFSGSTLEELQLVAQGKQFVATLEESTEYYIAIGVTMEEMFVDFDYYPPSLLDLSWGATPSNDSMATPTVLSGASGFSSFSHQHATVSAEDGLPAGLSSSLWWEWTPSESAWYEFKTTKTAGRIFDRRLVDSVIVIYDDSNGNRIATSDRTYFLSGEPQTTIYATSGRTYVIQTALREYTSISQDNEISLSWQSVETPPFSRYLGQLREVDADPDLEIRSLSSPKSIAANDSGDRLFVNGSDSLLVFDVADNGSLPSLTKEVMYEQQSGDSIGTMPTARLHWEGNNDLLYGIARDGIWLLQNVDTDDPYFAKCVGFSPAFNSVSDVVTDTSAINFFVLGEVTGGSSIGVYSRSENCTFTHSTSIDHESVSSLSDAHTLTTIGSADYVYVSTDRGILILDRDSTTGELSYGGLKADYRRGGSQVNWDDGSVMLSADNSHLFVVGTSVPAVGIYSLATPENPQLVDTIIEFYVPEDFFRPTPESYFLPDTDSGCRLVSVHAGTTAADFMCPSSLFTVELNEDDELILRDGLLRNNKDRFHTSLSGVSFDTTNLSLLGVRPESQNLYLLTRGVVDRLMVFNHASQITEDPYVD